MGNPVSEEKKKRKNNRTELNRKIGDDRETVGCVSFFPFLVLWYSTITDFPTYCGWKKETINLKTVVIRFFFGYKGDGWIVFFLEFSLSFIWAVTSFSPSFLYGKKNSPLLILLGWTPSIPPIQNGGGGGGGGGGGNSPSLSSPTWRALFPITQQFFFLFWGGNCGTFMQGKSWEISGLLNSAFSQGKICGKGRLAKDKKIPPFFSLSPFESNQRTVAARDFFSHLRWEKKIGHTHNGFPPPV